MTAKAPKIWTSKVWMNSRFTKGVDYPRPHELKLSAEKVSRYIVGEQWDDADFPEYIYFKRRVRNKRLPNIFNITNGLLTVSKRLADLLQEFDLGTTRLHEVELRENDRVTTTGQTFAILNICEHKHCFVREQSTGSFVEARGGNMFTPRDFEGLAVNASAAEGVDLWVDPRLRTTPFFSHRLVKALQKGRFGRLGLKPCTVVE